MMSFPGSNFDGRRRERAFTLLEMLVVIGIIAVLAVALLPAVGTMSKSQSRKSAISSLLGGIEQARAEAMRTGQSSYIVFTAFDSGKPATLNAYNYRCFAIFVDDPADATHPKQLTNWKTLPTGVAMRANSTSNTAVTNLPKLNSLPAPMPVLTFTPDTNAAVTYYVIKFNPTGEVDQPTNNIVLGVFEGFVTGTTETFTSGKDKNGNPLASEYLSISQHTGRAVPTATPKP